MGEDVLLLAIVAGSVVLGLGATAGFVAGGRRAERALGETLHAASSIVSSAFTSADSYRALDEMARRLAELLDADVCVVALPTGDGRLFCGPTFGFDEPEGLFIREEEGVCGAVYASGEPLVVPDVSKEPRFISRIEGIRSTVAVPLRHDERVLGSVAFESRTRVYTERDLSVLAPLADQIAAVLENLRLRLSAEERAAEENRIRKETQAISSVVMAGVSTTSDLDAALHSMIREISAQMGWESLAVVLYGDDGLLRTRAYYGYPLQATSESFRPGEGVIGGVAKEGVGRLIEDVSTEPDFLDLVQDTRAEMCVPLQIGTKTLGVLNAESPRAGAFTEEDLGVLTTLARQMAAVIERARLADMEREALEKLREADRLKDDFIATVSHELRTPLTSIKGYAETMRHRKTALSEHDRSSFLDVIIRQCDRLATIVDALLLVSRVEAGEIGGKPTFVKVDELVRGAVEDAGDGRRIDVRLSIADPNAGIVADHFRLHHGLRNLIENACKYSPPGAPVLVTGRVEEEELVVEVLDRGPGIPPGAEETIFERFSRLADPGRSEVPGTGLGLYIARRFARDLGGDIVVGRSGRADFSGAHLILKVPTVLAPVRSHPA